MTAPSSRTPVTRMEVMGVIDSQPPPPLDLSPLSSSSSASSRASTPLPTSESTSPCHPFDLLTPHTSEPPLPDKPPPTSPLSPLPIPSAPVHSPSNSSPPQPTSAPAPVSVSPFLSSLDVPVRLHPSTFVDPSSLTSFHSFVADTNRHSDAVDLSPVPVVPSPSIATHVTLPLPAPTFLSLVTSLPPPLSGPPLTPTPTTSSAPSPTDESSWKLQSRPSLKFCLKRSSLTAPTPSPRKKKTQRLDPLEYNPALPPIPPITSASSPPPPPPEDREARKLRESWERIQAREAADRARAQKVAAKREALAEAQAPAPQAPVPTAAAPRVEVDLDADVLASAQRHAEALRLIPSAPVLTPSMEEFFDPMAYIARHVNRHQDRGVVLIQPPVGWQPSYEYTLEEVTFACKRQVMKRYTDRHRKAQEEGEGEAPLPARPHMDGTALQVSALPFSDQMTMEEFRKVGAVKRGEWEALDRRWKNKARKLNSAAAHPLPSPGSSLTPTPTPATALAPLTAPPSSIDPTSAPVSPPITDSVPVPTSVPAPAPAPPAAAPVPATVIQPLSLAEDAYWRWSMYYGRVGRQPSVLYANDVDTHPSQRRPLTPTSPPPPRHLPPLGVVDPQQSPSGVLHYLDRVIPGITAPMLYIGMQFSTFCWHHEDHHLYSISYNHKGEPKTWYGVPGSHCGEVEGIAASDLYPFFDHQRDHILARKTSMFSPVLLRERGVPVYRAEQKEGMFVITFPRAYHSGFSHGFSLAESVNFALDDWLAAGYDATLMYRNISKFPVVPYPELVMRVVEAVVGGDGEEGQRWRERNVGMLMRVEECFSKLVWDELVERGKVYGEGRQPRLRLCHQVGKRATSYCDLCSHATYFSVMRCECRGVSLCLNHPACKQHRVEGSRVRLAYSSLELITLLSVVQSKLAG